MRRVFANKDGIMVNYLRSMLEGRGIECQVRNEFLGIAAGDLPMIDLWPELWVMHDAQFEEAMKILEGHELDNETSKTWTCPGCGEVIPEQFTECWKCSEEEQEPQEKEPSHSGLLLFVGFVAGFLLGLLFAALLQQ